MNYLLHMIRMIRSVVGAVTFLMLLALCGSSGRLAFGQEYPSVRIVDGVFRAGVSFANQWVHLGNLPGSLSDPSNQKMHVGFHAGAGIVVNIPSVPGLGVEIMAMVDRKGGRYRSYDSALLAKDGLDYGSAVKGKVALHQYEHELYYVNLPIHVVYSLEMFRTGLFVSGGVTPSYGFSGRRMLEGQPVSFDGCIFSSGRGREERLGHFDVSVGLRLGFRVMGIELSGYYDVGLLNIALHQDQRYRNGIGGISLGYVF